MRGRFLAEHIGHVTGHPAAFKRRRHRVFIDQRPARRVDDANAPLHRRNRRLADHAAVFARQRTVQRNNVAVREQLVKRHKAHVVPPRLGMRHADEHPHPESQRDSRDALADVPKADQADRLSGDFLHRLCKKAEIPARLPRAAAHLFAVCAHSAQAFQQQREGVLRHRLRGIRRGIRHDDAAPLRLRHIDDVVASRRHADVFHPRAGVHHLRRNQRFVGQNDLRVADPRRHVCLRHAVIDRHLAKLAQRVEIQFPRAEGIAVQNDNFLSVFHVFLSLPDDFPLYPCSANLSSPSED